MLETFVPRRHHVASRTVLAVTIHLDPGGVLARIDVPYPCWVHGDTRSGCYRRYRSRCLGRSGSPVNTSQFACAAIILSPESVGFEITAVAGLERILIGIVGVAAIALAILETGFVPALPVFGRRE